ncbi:MAG: cation:proton antiporter [Sphingomonadaceae bacterium]
MMLLSGGTVLILSLLAGLIVNRLWISEVTVCLLLGGGLALTSHWWAHGLLIASGEISDLELVARLTLAVAVMGVALRTPLSFFRRFWRDLMLFLGPILPAMWLTGAALAGFILNLDVLPALLVGPTVAPTDPVVAQSIVSGRVASTNIPQRVRRLVAGESAANDALGVMIVMLPLFLMFEAPDHAIGHCLRKILLRDLFLSVGAGAVFGLVTGSLFLRAKSQEYSEERPMLVIALALTFTTVATLQLLDGNGITGSFAAGLTFNAKISGIENQQHRLHGTVSRFLDLPAFVLIGLYAPWEGWKNLGWRGIAFALAVVVLRRLPWVLALTFRSQSLRTRKERLFVGWFGPVGVGAAFYAIKVQADSGIAWLWPIVSLVLFASVLVHGSSATPLAYWLGRHWSRDE